MTYTPPPYQPPQGPLGYYPPPYPGPGPATTLARRASIPLFALAAMGLLCGLFFGAVPWIVPADQLTKNPMLPQPPPGSNLTADQMAKIFYVAAAVMVVVGGLTLAACAAWVRSGRKAAIVTALVVSILVALWLTANVLAGLALGPAGLAMGACVGLIPGVPIALAILWLIQALRSGAGPELQQHQYAQQYWMLQQAQSPGAPGYGYGYGYGATPSPPPPTGSPAPQQPPGAIPPPDSTGH